MQEAGFKDVRKIEGDSLIWISEKFDDGDEVKVIKKCIRIEEGEQSEGGEHVYVIKKGDDETFDIFVTDQDAKGLKIKEEDGKVIKIIESENGDEKKVEVIVIKKGEGEDEWIIESENDEVIVKKAMKEKEEQKKKQELEEKEKAKKQK